ncbi:Uu.00g026440.m01.CDS01 [Anthostomella pinea]|uniref:Uu.00g026440.m01.CDS01 n=1 Tax=Anthostomella pinea TaxID=933095 RepID=A0AAI8V7I6_9PEZI|nr:Uu.00g026440.m01.CDS01 [Anthostomella pinea]
MAEIEPRRLLVQDKAGSDKSTLMRFVAHHPTTRSALASWTGSHELVIASHFFWNFGYPAQKP